MMYKKLKERRYKKCITTKEMSEYLNISKAFYCQIENGRRRLSYEMAVRIADFYGVKPDTLFYEETKENIDKDNKK